MYFSPMVRKVIEDFNQTFKAGTIYALKGESGKGKLLYFYYF